MALRLRTISTRLASALRLYEVVLLVSALWFVALCIRFVFPPLFDTFQHTYGLSNTETGLLFTLLLLGYSVVQFPSGVLADRYDEASVITLGTIVFTIAAFCIAATRIYVVLVVASVLIGVGTGPYKTVSIPLLSRIYPERTGVALGVMDTVGQFGGAIAPVVVTVVLASVLPWQTTFVVGAVVSLALSLAFYVRVSARDGDTDAERRAAEATADAGAVEAEPTAETGGSRSAPSTDRYASMLSNREFVAFVFVAIVVTFVWNGLSSFYPLYLVNEKGVDPGTASLLYGLLFAMSVSQTVTGAVSDRVGQVTVSLGLLALMTVTIPLLLVSESVLTLAFVAVLLGTGFHGFRPVRDSYLMNIIPESISAGVFGIVRTVMGVCGALAPVAVGFLSDTTGYAIAFGFLAALVLAGSTVVLSVKFARIRS